MEWEVCLWSWGLYNTFFHSIQRATEKEAPQFPFTQARKVQDEEILSKSHADMQTDKQMGKRTEFIQQTADKSPSPTTSICPISQFCRVCHKFYRKLCAKITDIKGSTALCGTVEEWGSRDLSSRCRCEDMAFLWLLTWLPDQYFNFVILTRPWP